MAEHYNRSRPQGRRPQQNRSQGRRPSQGRPSQGRYGKRFGERTPQKKLSLWQKVLKFLGLLKSPTSPQKSDKKASPKTNTRIAKSGETRTRNVSKLPVSVPRLYIGNLSYEASESDIEDLLKGIGPVNSVEIIYNPRTHKSKGYGFAEMRTLEDAHRAVEILHEQPFMGRNLTVSAANEREDSEESSPAPKERKKDTPAVEETVTPLQETVTPLVAEPVSTPSTEEEAR